MPKPKTSVHPKKSIIMDRVDPYDFLNLDIIYCCEQCSYFNEKEESCVLGFSPKIHRKNIQLKNYYLSGKMAFCRFTEID